MMALKQFNSKQAERWLQRLKTQNLQSYKDVIKFLRKYQKTEDQYDCYLKLSYTLLSHGDLAKDINAFLEDANKFIIPRGSDEKLKDFLGYVKKNRPEVFDKIIFMIQELNKTKGQGSLDVNKMIIPKLKEIIEGDEELQKLIKEAVDMDDQQLITNKNLQHLKINRPPQAQIVFLPDNHKEPNFSQSYIPRERKPAPQIRPQNLLAVQKKPKTALLVGNLIHISEQKLAFRQIQQGMNRRHYRYLMKIIKLYMFNIITLKETFSLLRGIKLEDVNFDNLREMLEMREVDRRKHSYFKPLGDINFGNYERPSPSYVTLPFFYPTQCSGKTAKIKAVTNDKWISVPYGSEENQNFSVRNKNMNEINILKAEDQRYEYDLYYNKIKTARNLIDRFLDTSIQMQQYSRRDLLRKAVNLGVIQVMYRNCKDQQKEEFQNFLNNNPIQTSKLFKSRLEIQISELKNIRDIHAYKSWNQIAAKNFYKALDLKGFDFKKNEKQKMKSQFFINELNERNKVLINGGELKAVTLSLEHKRQFFSIFNSFQGSSKKQKCHSRHLPPFETFDLKKEGRRHLYPVMILAFEDEQICQTIYSFLIFFIDNSAISEFQKTKHKAFMELYLMGYLKWKRPIKRCLADNFNQDHFINKLNNKSSNYRPEDYIFVSQEPLIYKVSQKKVEDQSKQKKQMKILDDQPSRYLYLPSRSDRKKGMYGSDSIYCLTRFLYAIYERLIRMRQVSEGTEKVKLFQLLFYTCIKIKESVRFEDNLNALFGDQAYLFSTIYKLFDSLLKSIMMSFNCPLTTSSFKLVEHGFCQDHQVILLNRFCLQNSLTSSKIVRLTFDISTKVLYFNYFDSYYKTQDFGKQTKKRIEISRDLQTYICGDVTIQEEAQKTRNTSTNQDHLINNQMESLFDTNGLKLHNHTSSQDVMTRKQRSSEDLRLFELELARANKMHAFIH